MSIPRAALDRANREWFEQRDRRIAEQAGLTLTEFRSKSEAVRARIISDPIKYKQQTYGKGQNDDG